MRVDKSYSQTIVRITFFEAFPLSVWISDVACVRIESWQILLFDRWTFFFLFSFLFFFLFFFWVFPSLINCFPIWVRSSGFCFCFFVFNVVLSTADLHGKEVGLLEFKTKQVKSFVLTTPSFDVSKIIECLILQL